MGNIKVRFNLGRGKNYKKWKVSVPDQPDQFFDPLEVTIILKNCKLVNNKKTAEKIFNGKNKSVCAWVSCSEVDVMAYSSVVKWGSVSLREISYNPKIAPNWVIDNRDADNENIDVIISCGKSLHILYNKVKS
jgi:hypothetical protein